MRTVWFECDPRPFAVTGRHRCHKATIGRLTIEEYRTRSRSRPYGLRMSAQLEAREDIRVVILEAINLASDLNVSWTYVAIAPLFPPSLIVRLVRCPPGWRTNAVAAKKALPHTRGSIDIRTRISQRKGVRATLNQMPLAPALVALKAYRASDEVVRLLIELHFQALSLHGSQASLILRAKALELCRAILPGRGDKSRQDALQPEIRHRMQRTYSWLMNIANNRVD